MDKDIELLNNFLEKNFNIKNMNEAEQAKYAYFYEKIQKLTNIIPSIEELEELKKLEVEFETKYEEFYELGNYFDPLFIKIKKYLHEKNIKDEREKLRKKLEEKV